MFKIYVVFKNLLLGIIKYRHFSNKNKRSSDTIKGIKNKELNINIGINTKLQTDNAIFVTLTLF